MLMSAPPPPDALYIGTLCAAVVLGLVLGILRARPAWHALGLGILFASIGLLSLWAHRHTTPNVAAETADIIGWALSPLPPASQFAFPGLWLLGFALWLYMTRRWMGPRTQRLIIAALWITVMCQVVAYYAVAGQFDALPQTSKEAFLDAVQHNAIMGNIVIGAQISGLLADLIIAVAPVVWRMRFTPGTPS